MVVHTLKHSDTLSHALTHQPERCHLCFFGIVCRCIKCDILVILDAIPQEQWVENGSRVMSVVCICMLMLLRGQAYLALLCLCVCVCLCLLLAYRNPDLSYYEGAYAHARGDLEQNSI